MLSINLRHTNRSRFWFILRLVVTRIFDYRYAHYTVLNQAVTFLSYLVLVEFNEAFADFALSFLSSPISN